MRFIDQIIVDWYDNILKLFGTNDAGDTYYFSLLAMDRTTDEKVYLCIDINYLKDCDQLKTIISNDTFKENWTLLGELIVLDYKNETSIVKAKDLLKDDIILINYKTNLALPEYILWGEYPNNLDIAAKIDNWFAYFNAK